MCIIRNCYTDKLDKFILTFFGGFAAFRNADKQQSDSKALHTKIKSYTQTHTHTQAHGVPFQRAFSQNKLKS